MNYATQTFVYHTDPGHGWIAVPLKLINELGISKDITPYSFRGATVAYLEEDCDAGLFFQSYEAKFGHKPKTRLSHTDKSHRIRNYRRFTTRPTMAEYIQNDERSKL
jgi:hypothetical protein